MSDTREAHEMVYGEHGLYQLGDSRTIYEDRFSRTAEVQPCDSEGNPQVDQAGQPMNYIIWEEEPYCVVLIIDCKENVYLTEQVKMASLEPLIEAVAGGIKPGQTAEEAAIAETLEEAGVTVKSITEVGQVIPQTHRFRERGTGVDGVPPRCKTAHHFVAVVDSIGEQQLEALERIKLMPPISIDDALEMCLDGRILNSDTVIQIMRYSITRFD